MTAAPTASLLFPGLPRRFGTGGDDAAEPLVTAVPFPLGLSQRFIDITHFPLRQAI